MVQDPVDNKKVIEIGPPHMWPEEAAALRRLLQTVKSNYLEFGTGGSTLMAVKTGIPRIVAVDSDPDWAAAVRQHAEIAPRISDGRAVVLHANIGPVANFGAPASASSMQRWPGYITTPWAEWERQGAFPEFVFVDGRFRVACCLSVIVARKLMGFDDLDPTVAMHDVQPERPGYARALDFFDVIETVRTFQVMRIKRNASPMRALLQMLESQFDGS